MEKRTGHILRTLAASFLLLLSFSGMTYAFPGHVTPYGDYCRDCTTYGAFGRTIPRHESLRALNNYYKGKGCRIGTFSYRGRFIQADIFKDDEQVDRVIFDRKTGRLRSIY